MLDFLGLIIFILPVYFANGIPVLLGGGARLDLGKDFIDGRPILGKGKTIRGFVSGIAAGAAVAVVLSFIYPLQWFAVSGFQFSVLGFQFPVSLWTLDTVHWTQILCGAAMALGTMVGDSVGSFFKRRLGIDSGRQFWPDTVVFLAFALAFAIPFVDGSIFALGNLAFLFALTIVLHPGSNFIANRLGLKKVPW